MRSRLVPNAKKRVGIWLRVSTMDQVTDESPEVHEKRARMYAESKGWLVVETYRLDAISGKSVWAHQETQRMLADVKSHRIDALIFSKLARLARNTRELLQFSDHFEAHSADLVSLHEAIDTSTPAGRLFYTIIAAMAQWEREEIADRVAASVPIRARLGKPLGGGTPFGYRRLDGHLVADPVEAPIRRRIFELYAEHGRRKTVARLLNQAGLRTRNGSKFSDTTVERLISDPIAKGVRRVNYTKSLGDNRGWKLKPESDWIMIPAEPLVSEELWERCNRLLISRKMPGNRVRKKPVHRFAGLVFCACGQRMYVLWKSTKYTCPKCRTKIAIDDLEAVYIEQLRSLVFSPAELASFAESADKTISDKTALAETLETERKNVSAEMEKVYRLYLSDQISTDGFGARYKPLEERLKQLDDQIPSLRGEIDFLRMQAVSGDEIFSEAQDLYSRWPSLTESEKRSIIETVTDRIVIDANEISMQLHYLPSLKTPGHTETTANKQHNLTDSSPRRR